MPRDTRFETDLPLPARPHDDAGLPAGAGVVIAVAAGALIWAALLLFFIR